MNNRIEAVGRLFSVAQVKALSTDMPVRSLLSTNLWGATIPLSKQILAYLTNQSALQMPSAKNKCIYNSLHPKNCRWPSLKTGGPSEMEWNVGCHL